MRVNVVVAVGVGECGVGVVVNVAVLHRTEAVQENAVTGYYCVHILRLKVA